MSDEEHSESEFYYPSELLCNENFEKNIANISSLTRCQFQIVQWVDKDSPRVPIEAKSRHEE